VAIQSKDVLERAFALALLSAFWGVIIFLALTSALR
jgi:hypothetical protein